MMSTSAGMWFILYFIVNYVFLTSVTGAKTKSMFAICDKNDDNRITKSELAVCMNMLPELETVESNTYTKINQLMELIDHNNDGSISAHEFQKATEKAQKAFDSEEYIEVTKADGTRQRVPKSELFNPMTGPGKGFEMKNDKVFKQGQETGKISELAEKDPSLGNMIRIGQWTAGQFRAANYTTGVLLKLESLPKGGSVVDSARLDEEPELLGVVFNGEFEVWMKLKIGNATEPTSTPQYFEAHVEYNREKYLPPYLAVLEAWELECRPGKRDQRALPLDMPPPRVRLRFWRWFHKELQGYAAHPWAGAICAVFVALFIATIFI